MTLQFFPGKVRVSRSLFFIVASCACSLIHLNALPYNVSSQIMMSNRILLVVWIIAIGGQIFHRLTRPVPKKYASLLILIVLTAISWMFSAISISSRATDNALSMAGFLLFPIMLGYSGLFRIDSRAKTVIYIYYILLSVLLIRLYHSDLRHAYDGGYGVAQIREVTLGYANPNQAAMYTLLSTMALFSGVFYFKSKYMKAFLLADGFYMAWIMMQTESRTVLILIVTFAVLTIISLRRELPEKCVDWAIALPAIYLFLLPIMDFLQQSFTFQGEGIYNGRERIFERYYDRLNILTFLIGDMNTFQFTNLHNGYLAIAASVGVIACICYVYFLRLILSRNRPDANSPVNERVAFIGALCTVMYVSTEAAFMVGGSNYAFMLFSLYVIFAKPITEPRRKREQ